VSGDERDQKKRWKNRAKQRKEIQGIEKPVRLIFPLNNNGERGRPGQGGKKEKVGVGEISCFLSGKKRRGRRNFQKKSGDGGSERE